MLRPAIGRPFRAKVHTESLPELIITWQVIAGPVAIWFRVILIAIAYRNIRAGGLALPASTAHGRVTSLHKLSQEIWILHVRPKALAILRPVQDYVGHCREEAQPVALRQLRDFVRIDPVQPSAELSHGQFRCQRCAPMFFHLAVQSPSRAA